MQASLSVWATSLGCPKNRADTEQLLGSLGLPVKAAKSPGRSRLVLINTCAFIEPATRESLRTIFDIAAQIRKLKRRPLLAVAGCLPGRYGSPGLAAEIPEVDLWLDSASIAAWPQMLAGALGLPQPAASGRLVESKSYAWLKISDGCQRQCSFCTIPSIRGPLRSIQAEVILKEAESLLAGGIKELALVGQDVTAWGNDLLMGALRGANASAPRDLADLLLKLRELGGLRWLRLMYLYPNSISDRLLEVIAEGLPVLPYLDIPFQHCQTRILTAMGRPAKTEPLALVEKIRRYLPDAALRATLMTGYPGETDADFEALYQFVRQARFQNLGVFAFMAEEGTKAANLPAQVPEHVREERAAEIMRIQAETSSELLAACLGKRLDVLVDAARDDEWPGLHAGRVWFQAPEVDGITYISGENVTPGNLVNAEIVDTQIYDLSALS